MFLKSQQDSRMTPHTQDTHNQSSISAGSGKAYKLDLCAYPSILTDEDVAGRHRI